jgi:hypothetical protein
MIERCQGVSAESEAEKRSAMSEVVEAEHYHCGMMARRMRKVHLDILASGGVSAHRELIWVFGGTYDDPRRGCMCRVPTAGATVNHYGPREARR